MKGWRLAKARLTPREYRDMREMMRPYWERMQRENPQLHDVMDETQPAPS